MRLALFIVIAACSPMHYTAGVPNLAPVSSSIYRSGQISTAEGWDTIARLAGARKVHVVKLNFETEGSDSLAAGRGWELLYLPIQPEGDQDAWDDATSVFASPDEATVAQAVTTLNICRLHPTTDFCLVHCTHGQDRTGYVVGRHRVTDDGWTLHRAYSEMIEHNFHWELVGLSVAWLKFAGAGR